MVFRDCVVPWQREFFKVMDDNGFSVSGGRRGPGAERARASADHDLALPGAAP